MKQPPAIPSLHCRPIIGLIVLVVPVRVRGRRALAIGVLAARGIGADVIRLGAELAKRPPERVPAASVGNVAQVPVVLQGDELGKVCDETIAISRECGTDLGSFLPVM